MSDEPDNVLGRETLRQQIADGHGFALYRHYAEREAAAWLGLHPVTLKKARLAGSIGYIAKGRRAIAYFGFQIAKVVAPLRSRRRRNSTTLGDHANRSLA